MKLFSRYLTIAALALAHWGVSAALIGGDAQEPKIDFPGSGIVSYKKDATGGGVVTISGIPSTLLRTSPFVFGAILPTPTSPTTSESLVSIQFRIDAAGNFVSGGVAGSPDLVVIGEVDVDSDGVVDYKGTLLTGSVTGFGFQDSAFGTTDGFDLRVTITGGVLKDGDASTGKPPIYTNTTLVVQVTSESSTEFPTPFGGSFAADWKGPAKGVMGTAATVVQACKLSVDATCSTNGVYGPFQQKCRIDTYKSPMWWDFVERTVHGKTYSRHAYGLHGTSEPAWSRNRQSQATAVTFRYVVKNTGTTAISNLLLDDSFDTDPVGVPTTLAPGAQAIVKRTERLREAVDVTLLAAGQSPTGDQCTASDTVSIKKKLKDRRRYDDDDFEDKGDDDRNSERR